MLGEWNKDSQKTCKATLSHHSLIHATIHPPWHFSGQGSSYITLHKTLIFNIAFSGPAISINFYPFLSISDALSAISRHVGPFLASWKHL